MLIDDGPENRCMLQNIFNMLSDKFLFGIWSDWNRNMVKAVTSTIFNNRSLRRTQNDFVILHNNSNCMFEKLHNGQKFQKSLDHFFQSNMCFNPTNTIICDCDESRIKVSYRLNHYLYVIIF